MRYERFIAKRYLSSGRFFISVATWITILGVTLGVAVVCFVMSMHNGFESEIRTRLLGTTSHISIFPLSDQLISNYMDLVEKVQTVEGVEAASPFIYYKTAISSSTEGDGVIIRGIIPEMEERTAAISKNIKYGVLDFQPIELDGDTIAGIVLGADLAERLGVFCGESVVLFSLKKENLTSKARPRVAKFYVAGIFESGLYEFDAQMAYISLESAQKLFKTGDKVTAIHLKLTDIYLAEEITPLIDAILDYKYDVVPWYILHKNLFSWIELEKLALGLGFVLVILVAAFSIISTMVMMTMEKRSEIGILKTIGSTPFSIFKIFVYKGLTIAIIGVASGFGIALLAAFIQNKYQVISLPPDIYFISYLPIEVHALDFGLVGVVTFAICFLASMFPSYQASKVSVIEVLRK